jgi:hypothetical protein
MALDFVKTNVKPGEPVTAQAWNAIVDGLFEVESILSAGSGTARVTLTGDQRDIDVATVVATDANGVRYAATRQAKPGDPFMIPRLAAGAYTVTASARGCTDGTAAVTIANDGTATPNPVPVALVLSGKRMPYVLGAKFKDVVGAVQTINPRVLDASGKGVPLTGFDAAHGDAPVLMQWPDPDDVGERVGAGSGGHRRRRRRAARRRDRLHRRRRPGARRPRVDGPRLLGRAGPRAAGGRDRRREDRRAPARRGAAAPRDVRSARGSRDAAGWAAGRVTNGTPSR